MTLRSVWNGLRKRGRHLPLCLAAFFAMGSAYDGCCGNGKCEQEGAGCDSKCGISCYGNEQRDTFRNCGSSCDNCGDCAAGKGCKK